MRSIHLVGAVLEAESGAVLEAGLIVYILVRGGSLESGLEGRLWMRFLV